MKVTLVPAQIVVAEAETETDGVTKAFTVMVIPVLVAVAGEGQGALLVITIETTSLFASVVVVKVALFVPAFTPFTFHWYAGAAPPFVGVAVNVALAPVHIVVAEAEIETEGVTMVFTVMVIPVLVAVAGEGQVALLVMTTVTTLLFARVVEVKVVLLVPAFTPFTFHWYEGAAPPFVGVAVKVTLVPAQIVVAEAETATEGVTTAFTVMVIPVLVAEAGEGQAALLVITTVTTSLLESVVVVKVALFVPAFTPFTFHW